MSIGVRPTKRALTDLDLTFPPLTERLEGMGHPLIIDAQTAPEKLKAGGAKRVIELRDRSWFKVKTMDYRGATGQISDIPDDCLQFGPFPVPDQWWLVAAGHRRGDTPNQDFYGRLVAEAERAGKGTGSVNTDGLLPKVVDFQRWRGEAAAVAVVTLQEVVRGAIARSAQTGHACTATLTQPSSRNHEIEARVASRDGDTYLTISSEGFVDPKLIAVILDAVPQMSADDWIAEDNCSYGQIMFSAMIPQSALSEVLEGVDGHFL